MSADTAALERDIRAAYEAARGRQNAPWQHLDARFGALSQAVAQSRRRECGYNSAEDHAARAYEQVLLDNALTEFCRWQDMEAAQFQAEAARVIWDAEQAAVHRNAPLLPEAS